LERLGEKDEKRKKKGHGNPPQVELVKKPSNGVGPSSRSVKEGGEWVLIEKSSGGEVGTWGKRVPS